MKQHFSGFYVALSISLPMLGLGAGGCGDGGSSTSEALIHASDDDVIPKDDDAESYQARFSAVASVVGEEAAQKLMVHADEKAEPIYELTLQNGNRVSWYEPMAGFLAVSVVGTSSASYDAGQFRGLHTASDAFRAIAPGQPVPLVLTALDERQAEFAPLYRKLQDAKERFASIALPGFSEDATDPTPSEDFRVVEQSLTAEECINKAKFSCVTNPWDWLVTQKNRTATSTITQGDTFAVEGIGCCQTGDITYRVRYQEWWSYTQWFAHDLAAGWWVGQWNLGLASNNDFDFEGMLFNFAAGDKGSQCATGALW